MLRITLRDGEKAIINGAVVRAVGRTQFCVENQAAILRGRDVMRPEEANTPARQLYFAAMLAYIDPENRIAHQDALVTLLGQLVGALDSAEGKAACVRMAHDLARGDYYKALGAARELLAVEAAAVDAQAA